MRSAGKLPLWSKLGDRVSLTVTATELVYIYILLYHPCGHFSHINFGLHFKFDCISHLSSVSSYLSLISAWHFNAVLQSTWHCCPLFRRCTSIPRVWRRRCSSTGLECRIWCQRGGKWSFRRAPLARRSCSYCPGLGPRIILRASGYVRVSSQSYNHRPLCLVTRCCRGAAEVVEELIKQSIWGCERVVR